MINLFHLNLSGTQVTFAGLTSLNGMTRLSVFDLGGTQVTAAEMKDLRQTWPSLKITR